MRNKDVERDELKNHSGNVLQLRVEQDLAATQAKSHLGDDIHYEKWVDNLQNKIEAAELAKYLYDTPLANVY